jgi:serine/threonine protein kinase/Tol biopolymer transport system component
LIGTTLSHFRITAKLGEGGMGEVYRAEDTRLGREVAIKVLPEAVAGDPERLARFEREAKLLASLNHPHIAAIYSIESARVPGPLSADHHRPEESGAVPLPGAADRPVHFLVMELAEGEDLRERLDRGPVPVDEALPIALQIAEALEAAHASGVIHRDLKPANVKVTPAGEVKVLDFGLAKALDPTASDLGELATSPAVIPLSLSPTLTQQMTGAGVILGTAAYMAPEQARGKKVDRRADVWAFGVLVWEMLSGQALFAGETVTDVLAAVVTKEPDLTELPAETPQAVQRLLERCLRKDPRRRMPEIGAARLELEDVLHGETTERWTSESDLSQVVEAERRGRSRERLMWAATVLVVAGLGVAALFLAGPDEPAPQPPVHFTTAAPEGWSLARPWQWPVPSPDGTRVAFLAYPSDQVSAAAGQAHGAVWLRSLEAPTAQPLVGGDGAIQLVPAWSPDGQSILIGSNGELRKLRLADGLSQKVTTFPAMAGFTASWGVSGTILLCEINQGRVVYSVPDTGGDARPLTTLDTSRDEVGHLFPQFLEDGRRFLFMVGSDQNSESAGLFLASLDDPDQRRKVADGWVRRVLVGEHLLFVSEGTLFAQLFDPRDAVPSGDPIGIASSVRSWSVDPNMGWFGASVGGTISYVSAIGTSGVLQLAWVDRSGREPQTIGPPGYYGQIALSPDSRNVALEIRDGQGQYDLWVMEIARGVTSRVTVDPADERDPVWSPDGRSLAYIRRTADGALLLRKGLRASDPETELMDSPDEHIPESWAADGETLMVVRRTATDEQSVWALSTAEGGEARAVLDAGFRVDEPQLSPDGRWLAYVSPESNQDEVYLEPFEREGDRVRVSLNGGGQPKWRGDSRELFFVTEQGQLMAVEVGGDGGRLEVSLPRELFELGSVEGMGYDDYAVDADGTRFLVKIPVEAEVEPQLEIIVNWQGLLD